MTREHYMMQLEEVKHNLLRMGTFVEKVIEMSIKSLTNHDVELAQRVPIEDDSIDRLEIAIEQQCITILALQQPLAKDLRIITTALKIITDLERMGDNAVNISKKSVEIGKDEFIKPLVDIPVMAEMAQKMVRLSLDAFVKEDVDLAEQVAEMDNEVDELYSRIVDDIMELISQDRKNIQQATKLLFVARYLERIADHTTNICERTIYLVTGELKEIN